VSLAVATPPAAPWFEDLPVGTAFTAAPALTLTEGHAALHQAIAGDRLRLALDRTLAAAVVGEGPAVAHPGLVWDAAIGQSTVATGRVVANLFYRGLLLRRVVRLGDTLRTTTEVVARRENRVKEGRRPTGLVLLRIRTVDQADRPVLDFTRCAMLPLRGSPSGEPGDEVGGAADLEAEPLRDAAAGLDLAAFRAAAPGPHFDAVPDGWGLEIEGGDVVDSAPALGRLTLNVAMAHLDAGSNADGRRLVYGGHAIGLAAGQAARALPSLVTILGWHACEHTAPVFEGDTLRSRIELERREPLPGGGGLLHLRSRVTAARADGGEDADVLDWRFVAVLA
jgi:acyl dehydratase